MYLAALFDAPARYQAANEGRGVSRHALFPHLLGAIQRRIVATASDVRAHQGVPGDDISGRKGGENGESIAEKAALGIHIDHRIRDRGVPFRDSLAGDVAVQGSAIAAAGGGGGFSDESARFQAAQVCDIVRNGAFDLEMLEAHQRLLAMAELGEARDERGPGDHIPDRQAVEQEESVGGESALHVHVDERVSDIDVGIEAELRQVAVKIPPDPSVLRGGAAIEERHEEAGAIDRHGTWRRSQGAGEKQQGSCHGSSRRGSIFLLLLLLRLLLCFLLLLLLLLLLLGSVFCYFCYYR
jgi:hypothetical protein